MNSPVTYVLKVWMQPQGGFRAQLRAVDEELATRFDDAGSLVRHLHDAAVASGGGAVVARPASAPPAPSASTHNDPRSPT